MQEDSYSIKEFIAHAMIDVKEAIQGHDEKLDKIQKKEFCCQNAKKIYRYCNY